MDPITAIFIFLATPPGQVIATKLIALNDIFLGILGDLIRVVHKDNPAPALPVPAPVEPAK